MPQSAQEIFQLHRMQEYEPLLRGVWGTYVFDIEQVGCWFAAVDDGKIRIAEGKHDADCVIRCSKEDFVDIGSRKIPSYQEGGKHAVGRRLESVAKRD
jgi:hypothetical protein